MFSLFAAAAGVKLYPNIIAEDEDNLFVGNDDEEAERGGKGFHIVPLSYLGKNSLRRWARAVQTRWARAHADLNTTPASSGTHAFHDFDERVRADHSPARSGLRRRAITTGR